MRRCPKCGSTDICKMCGACKMCGTHKKSCRMQTRRNIKGAGIDWYLKNKAKRSSVVPSKYDVLDQTVNARKNKKGSQSSRSIIRRVGQFVKSMRPRNDARVHTKDDVGIGLDEINVGLGGRKLRKSLKKKQAEIDSAGVIIDFSATAGRKSRKSRKSRK